MREFFRKFDIWIVSAVIIFVLPWVHRIAFENLMKAIPGIGSGSAHVLVFFVSITAPIAAAFATGRIAP